jgi:hypothetical protein
MKTKEYLFVAISVAMMLGDCTLAKAQDDDESNDFGTRISGEVDKKICKGLHVSLSEELRFNDFDFDRTVTGIGVSYKINSYLKVGGAYYLIGVDDTDFEWRHRGVFDLTESYKTSNDWKFSLRERFQATYKAYDINEYQKPKTEMALRFRFKVSKKISNTPLEPYASFELKYLLNGARWEDEVYKDHGDSYVNRLRGQAGLDWKISQRSGLDFYMIFDHNMETVIDSNKEGTTLKSMYDNNFNKFTVGVSYKFSF